jgi:putative hemolysin
VIAGAFGGARLSEHLVPHLAPLPLVGSYARPVAFGVVVLLITYLSLVLGELVPKRIGLGNPEGVALLVSRFMRRVSATCAPVVDLLSGSTDMLLGIFGFKSNKGSQITEDEVRGLMSEGMRAGAFNKVGKRDCVQCVGVGSTPRARPDDASDQGDLPEPGRSP